MLLHNLLLLIFSHHEYGCNTAHLTLSSYQPVIFSDLGIEVI